MESKTNVTTTNNKKFQSFTDQSQDKASISDSKVTKGQVDLNKDLNFNQTGSSFASKTKSPKNMRKVRKALKMTDSDASESPQVQQKLP